MKTTITKVSEIKKGDRIEWAKKSSFSSYAPVKDGEGVVIDKKGRNILVVWRATTTGSISATWPGSITFDFN